MTNPTLISTPFAANGDKNPIQETTPAAPNNPTWEAGFPVITSTPINEGGLPPTRLDMNGVFNAVTDNIVHQSKGLMYEFDAAYATKIGGYPLNSRLMLTNGEIVQSTIANNTVNPNVDLTGWKKPTVTASSVINADGRTQQEINDKVDEFVSVLDFGIHPNTGINLGSQINAADASAKSRKKSLYFPSGEYIASGLTPSTGWTGDGIGSTIIKAPSGTSGTLSFINASGITNSTFKGIEFDANVNEDPTGSWSGIFDTWFVGAAGFSLSGSSGVKFDSCKFGNSKPACLRVTGSSRISIFNCEMKRARGPFGDGIYLNSVDTFVIANNDISDITRIGYVYENNTKNGMIIGSSLANAHHASIDLGGGEYNGGFWAENSAHIMHTNCTATDFNYYGFLNTTGSLLLNEKSATFVTSGCRAKNGRYGFVCQSKSNSVSASHTLANCSSESVSIAISYTPAKNEDSLNVQGGMFSLGGTLINAKSLINVSSVKVESDTILPSLTMENTVVAFEDFDQTKYQNTADNYADISFLSGVNCIANIKNVKNANQTIPVYFKSRGALTANSLSSVLNIKDCNISVPIFQNNGIVNHTNTNVVSTYTGSPVSIINFFDSYINGMVLLSGGRFNVDGCLFDYNNTSYFRYASSENTPSIVGRISNSRFRKDVTTNDYSLRIQMDGTTKPKVVLTNLEFYNTSSTATSTKTFLWVVRTGTTIVYQNVLRDASTSFYKIDTVVQGTDPAGVTPVTVH